MGSFDKRRFDLGGSVRVLGERSSLIASKASFALTKALIRFICHITVSLLIFFYSLSFGFITSGKFPTEMLKLKITLS